MSSCRDDRGGRRGGRPRLVLRAAELCARLSWALGAGVVACAPQIHVEDATAVMQSTGAGVAYMRVVNDGFATDVLMDVLCDDAWLLQLHEIVDDDGAPRMQAVDGGLVLGGRSELSFAPGGRHVMLFGVLPELAAIPLTLRFADSADVHVLAELRP